MQKLIAGYLFQHKRCALCSAGTLEIRNEGASSVLGEQKLIAPKPVIHFSNHPGNTSDLEEYIAANKQISKGEAAYQLNKFCEEINALRAGEDIKITGAGKFYRDADSNIAFQAEDIPFYFLPEVHAERVIHPDKAHSILVGDTETDSTAMTEYYTETPGKKSKWWIWAAVLFVMAAGAVFFYLNDKDHNSFFGISHKYEAAPAGDTYKKLP